MIKGKIPLKIRMLIAKEQKDKIKNRISKDKVFFHNKVVLLNPEHPKEGITVITSQGIGRIYSITPKKHYSQSQRLPHTLKYITVTNITVELRKKYYRTFHPKNLFYYAVYNNLLKSYIPLSARCYNYIAKPGQKIVYTLTKRGYAMLSDKYMIDKEYIRIFNTKRGGRSILLHLLKKGYQITKNQ